MFCLCCYLFKSEIRSQVGLDVFVSDGFSTWNTMERLEKHVGSCDSAHNTAIEKCQNLMKQSQSLQSAFDKKTDQAKKEYRTRLNASDDCVRFLLRQGLSFRGNNEAKGSKNRGNFLELLQSYADRDEKVGSVSLENAPKNNQLTCSDIQKEIVETIAAKTTQEIIEDLNDDYFCILVDESRDVSCKEQMAVALHFVDRRGCVMERLIGIVHVSYTSTSSLKSELDRLLLRHRLSLAMIRGQGYDGASNMRGELNGLKTLIMRDTESAYYVHYFAHQLPLTLVFVAKNHLDVNGFFDVVARLLNMVGASCKQQDNLREKQAKNIVDFIACGELETGSGLNQEISLQRSGDTRWSSHYASLVRISTLFSSIIDVLKDIERDGEKQDQRAEARRLNKMLSSFDFTFILHLMLIVLGATNELNLSLQKKDQDIVNIIALVDVAKTRMLEVRNEGWESLLAEVCSFCEKYDIPIQNMNDSYVRGRSHRASGVSNLHHYKINIMTEVLDMQHQELDTRFNKVNTELLYYVGCLSPSDSFSAFDQQKLLRMAEFYPCEFSSIELVLLKNQLPNYIADVLKDERFKSLKGISDLSNKMVETKKQMIFPHVYLLLKLALILPVATVTVERAFSAMKLIKSKLRNRMGDEWLNDCLIPYVEKDILDSITNEEIMLYFLEMKPRRGEL